MLSSVSTPGAPSALQKCIRSTSGLLAIIECKYTRAHCPRSSTIDALDLEWNDYARTAWFASVVPMMEVTISSQAVFLSNSLLPSSDGNHAALLRTSSQDCDALIRRVIEHYQARGVPPCVAVSPSCLPSDLPDRLLAHGFIAHGDPEYWLVLADPTRLENTRGPHNCTVQRVGPHEVSAFCQVMETAFGMPEGASWVLEHVFGPINSLPGIYNYLATLDGQPAGCASLFTYNGFSAFGSGGTLPGMRSLAVGGALIEQVCRDWTAAGRPVMVAQTVLPKLERVFNHIGFRRVFSRSYYILE